jgi:very-short-patch-repair endonuclease
MNILGYYADIVLLDKKIIIEYNGSGHTLPIKMGQMSELDFKLKEEKRFNNFINDGWKCLVVENIKDKKITNKRLRIIESIINNITNDLDSSFIHYDIQ